MAGGGIARRRADRGHGRLGRSRAGTNPDEEIGLKALSIPVYALSREAAVAPVDLDVARLADWVAQHAEPAMPNYEGNNGEHLDRFAASRAVQQRVLTELAELLERAGRRLLPPRSSRTGRPPADPVARTWWKLTNVWPNPPRDEIGDFWNPDVTLYDGLRTSRRVIRAAAG